MNTIIPYNRQQTVYLLNIPKEIADIILSFTFYDKSTGESRKLHRSHMYNIVYRFKNAVDSRALGIEWLGLDPDNDEHWHISFHNFEEDRNTQFQAINCKYCGEYLFSSFPVAIPCRCIRAEQDEQYYSDDEEGEYDHLW